MRTRSSESLDSKSRRHSPGYGFLPENAALPAAAVESTNLTFIGPSPDSIRAMGRQSRGEDRQLKEAGIPTVLDLKAWNQITISKKSRQRDRLTCKP
ncbi:MAG: hypothetical protein IPJ46_07710 [Anaerolineales bacterium]|nr:hypothetical protein [Anaerolineales bacterium]